MRLPSVVLALLLLGILGSAQSQEPISLNMDVEVAGFDRSTPFIVVEPGNPGSVMFGNDQEGVSVEVLADRTVAGDIEVSGVVTAWLGDSVEDSARLVRVFAVRHREGAY